MTFTRTTTQSTIPAIRPPRDATIDAVRAGCLLVVVVLHSLMVGVEYVPGEGLVTSVALSGQPWFAPVTWVIQIMPLFFIAGGYVSLLQWRRMRASGASAGEYVAGRVRRLAVPAIVMITAVGSALCVARMFGADPSLIDEASLRVGQPLWFLAVYFGVTALVPAMAWAHERRPIATIAALGAGVLLCDLLGAHTGLPFGYVNFILVWPLMQQLGFVLLDGGSRAWTRPQLISGMLTALVALGALVANGWSPDMLVNLNPPTTAIALLGTAQFFGVQFIRPTLDRATRVPVVARFVERAGTLAMDVYLWHMPIILTIVALMWIAQLPMPAPHSALWWATRVPWVIAIFACVVPFARLTRRCTPGVVRVLREFTPQNLASLRFIQRFGATLSVLCGISGTVVALLVGVGTFASCMGAVALLSAGTMLALVVTLRPRIKDSSYRQAWFTQKQSRVSWLYRREESND
ncbi:MAG: acyltransferase family protein [Leucobacter sp.]